jgi:hypothetical protein
LKRYENVDEMSELGKKIGVGSCESISDLFGGILGLAEFRSVEEYDEHGRRVEVQLEIVRANARPKIYQVRVQKGSSGSDITYSWRIRGGT